MTTPTDTSFLPDLSPQPATHPPVSPPDGAVSTDNPPALTWRVDERAVTYTVEMSPDPEFSRDVVRAEWIDMPFYNGQTVLAEGTWHWRYSVVLPDGRQSLPSPSRTFLITPDSVPLPVPPTSEILSRMPDHPRVFVTPDTLDEFRSLKEGASKEAWEHLKHAAEGLLDASPSEPTLLPMPVDPGEDRGQVFLVREGIPYEPKDYHRPDLSADAQKVNILSYAYLISGDERYAHAAVKWMDFVSQFRVDLHLEDRGQHDTVVYCYEYGLKSMALGYDRVCQFLEPDAKQSVLDHIEYHCLNAMAWIRGKMQIHLNYQNSHGQQCMHALLTTVLAVATDIPKAAEWTDYLVRQYVNRIAWGNNDGGYTEGQKYGHKVQFIVEGLAALRSAAGLDLFQEPRWRNSGDFWLYCMSLNYWWNHWGDCYSLIDPNFGSDADTYVTALLASLYKDRQVRWYSETRVTNPAHVPFWYLSGTGVTPKPPVDIPQARLFPEVGQLAAFDRFYDHAGNRIFFRSSPWGSHSHSHRDQNGFVLHAGGEILACDAGYYTYSGDSYSGTWSQSTAAHNSLLVNGESQPKGIAYKGKVSAFFNAPGCCVFTGDAGEAYGDLLDRFDRTIVFIRPDVWIVHDRIRTPKPARFTWTLNAFEAADINETAQQMVVRQRDQRLDIHHLSPGGMSYTQNNDRPFPMKTKFWTRFTEAFPQQWNIRVTTAEETSDGRILSLLHTHNQTDGPTIEGLTEIRSGDTLGARYNQDGAVEWVLFADGPGAGISAEGVESDADVVSLRLESGQPARWTILNGTRLRHEGADLWQSNARCSASVDLTTGFAAAQVTLSASDPVACTFRLPGPPRTVWQAPPCRPADGATRPVSWQDDCAIVEIEAPGDTVLWIDPAADLSRSPESVSLRITDSDGASTVTMETAWADNGDVVAFAQIDPREPGAYTLSAADGVEILVQDHWDPELRAAGTGTVTATLREATEIILRFPSGTSPDATAGLSESLRGSTVNLLANGGFEAGVTDYPPRGWNVNHPRTDDLGWPEWSQDGPAEGTSCLRFYRPKDRISCVSRPMRLRRGGPYVLSFKARGDATHARVTVYGQLGARLSLPIEPSSDWREYRAELDASPGYCTVTVAYNNGGHPDQVIYVDDVQFGYTA
jgi:hypothetical protein